MRITDTSDQWWKTAVVYCLDVETFFDSDGDEEKALAIAHDQWRSNVFSSDLAWNLELPVQFDAAAELVRPEDVRSSVLVSADLGRHVAELRALVDLGIDGLYLHHVGQEQEGFIHAFGERVLPHLTASTPTNA